MMITRDEFITTYMPKLCKNCIKKARIEKRLWEQLPEKSYLFEMQEKFHEIVMEEG